MGLEGSMVWARDLKKSQEKNKKLRKQIAALQDENKSFVEDAHHFSDEFAKAFNENKQLQGELDSLKAAKGMTDMGFSPEHGKLTYFEEFVKKHPQCYLDEGMKAEIEELQAELEGLKKRLKEKAEFDMPADMQGKFHNACTDACDMIDGPCACGAWHNAKEWLGKLCKQNRQFQTELEKYRWIPVEERPKKKKESSLGYIVTDGCRFHKAYYDFSGMCWCCSHPMNEITHYQIIALPEPK